VRDPWTRELLFEDSFLVGCEALFVCCIVMFRRNVVASTAVSEWASGNANHGARCHIPEDVNFQGQVCTRPGRQAAQASKFCTMASNICGRSVRNWLLAPF
jgi:hypothetical protein